MSLKKGDPVEVVDTEPAFSATWPGVVTGVIGHSAVEVTYGGGTEQFRMPEGVRGTRMLRVPKPAPPPLSPDDYVFLPVDQAEKPGKGTYFQRYAGAWWAVHPEKGLVFYNPRNARTGRRRHSYLGSPQCNADERIARVVSEHSPFPVEVRQFPLVWVQVDMHDYDH